MPDPLSMTQSAQPPRICRAPGCEDVAVGGPHCPRCAKEALARKAARKVAFDKRRAGDPHRRIYKTARWREGRAVFLSAHPNCKHCAEMGRLRAATDVDHIIPVRQRPELAFDQSNWQALCAPCHSRKTATEDSAFARR